MRKIHLLGILLGLAFALTGCGGTSGNLAHVSTTADGPTMEDAFTKVKGTLASSGFDIAKEDKEAGFITTTYKKWSYKSGGGSEKGEETHILRLQLRASLSEQNDGKINVVLTPGVKELIEEEEPEKDLAVSLVEAAVDITKAVTGSKGRIEEDLGDDVELKFYKKKEREIKFFTSEEKKIKVKMLKTVLKTGKKICRALGLKNEQLKLKIEK